MLGVKAGGERKEAYRNPLKGLIERGVRGVRLVTSNDHESIKQTVAVELDEFLKAGGSAKCLTLRLDGEEAAAWKAVAV